MFRIAFISNVVHLVTERALLPIVPSSSSSLVPPSMVNLVVRSLAMMVDAIEQDLCIHAYILIQMPFLLQNKRKNAIDIW